MEQRELQKRIRSTVVELDIAMSMVNEDDIESLLEYVKIGLEQLLEDLDATENI